MDINDLRITVTHVSLELFLALMAHTFSRRRKADFDDAAMLPFREEAAPEAVKAQGEPA